MSTYQDNFDKLFASVLENTVLPPICEWLRKNKEVDVSVSELRSAMRLPAAPKSRTSERPAPKTKKAVASTTGALDSEPENGCKWKFERGPSKDKFCGKSCYQEGDTVYPLCKTHITTVGGHDRLVNEGWDLPQEVTLKKRSSGTSSSSKKSSTTQSSGVGAKKKSSALKPQGKKKEIKSYTIHRYDRNFADKVQERSGLSAQYFAHTFVYPVSENGDGDILYYQDPKTKKGMFLYMLNAQDEENPLREPTEEEKKKIQSEGFVLEPEPETEDSSSSKQQKSQEQATSSKKEEVDTYPDPDDDLEEDDGVPVFDEEDEQ